MQFAAIIAYVDDRAAIKAIAPAHRTYLRGLLDGGLLCGAGPLTDEGGALWICEAQSTAHVDQMIKDDPSYAAGVIVSWQIHALAYWSAKPYKAGIPQ